MSAKRPALGKGLSALLQNANTDVTTKAAPVATESKVVGAVANIPVEQIEANPFQPRTNFEQSALEELTQSIQLHGIIQPLTVRKLGYDKYQLISGERRFRASQMAGLTEVPAYIRIANDQAMLEMALVENIQREDLNAIEVAVSYKRLIEECNLTQEQLSEKVGKQRSTIANYLRLLKLPPDIQIGIRDKQISMGHARALVNIDNVDVQKKVYQDIIDKELSVRKVEDLARWQNKKPDSLKPRKKSAKSEAAELNSYEDNQLNEELSKKFNTLTEIKRSMDGKGKIILYFNSEEEYRTMIENLLEL